MEKHASLISVAGTRGLDHEKIYSQHLYYDMQESIKFLAQTINFSAFVKNVSPTRELINFFLKTQKKSCINGNPKILHQCNKT